MTQKTIGNPLSWGVQGLAGAGRVLGEGGGRGERAGDEQGEKRGAMVHGGSPEFEKGKVVAVVLPSAAPLDGRDRP